MCRPDGKWVSLLLQATGYVPWHHDNTTHAMYMAHTCVLSKAMWAQGSCSYSSF